jgi:hypothetical protein
MRISEKTLICIWCLINTWYEIFNRIQYSKYGSKENCESQKTAYTFKAFIIFLHKIYNN